MFDESGVAVQIIKKVLVKQVITEQSKTNILESFQTQKAQLEQECQQLNFESRKLQKKTGLSKQEVNKRFQKEINKRQEKMKAIDFKMEQLDTLAIGTEIIQNEVEALVEVEVGMDWNQLMEEQAIIIKDGMVIRMDNAGD